MTTTSNAEFDEIFEGQPLMAIFRGMGVERSLELAERAWDLGIDVVELPIQTEADLEALRVVAAAGRAAGRLVGAGTVVSVRHVELAASAGAAFTVSPELEPPAERPSAVAHVLREAPRAARVRAAAGARAAGRSAWTRASTVPPPAGDGGDAPTSPVGPVRSARAGICGDEVVDATFPTCLSSEDPSMEAGLP